MTLFQSVVLGIVQGATEFLPVSSSAHLALIPWMMKWQDQGLAYDVALHWGTLLAVAVYFRKDWTELIRAGLARKKDPAGRLFFGICVATVPGVLAGLLAKDHIAGFFRDPVRIALSLMLFGIILAVADSLGKKSGKLEGLSWRDCLFIGLGQALAVIPGVSRSGITLTVGLLLGLKRVEAARFSFLMSLPIILGAGVLKAKDLDPSMVGLPFVAGIVLSALTGLVVIKYLLRYLEKGDMRIFGIYRVGLGLLVILLANAEPPVKIAKHLGLSAPVRPPVESLSPPALRLRSHVQVLAEKIGERSAVKLEKLDLARDYVAGEFKRFGYEPEIRPYHAKWMGAIKNGTTFYNIIVKAGPPDSPEGLLVIGAHYDTAYNTPGADDNASGTAVLLEMARRFGERPPPIPVRLVAFSSEEPPAFDTVNMGSHVDAQDLKKAGVKLRGMISLEMLGYYDSRRGSQIYAPFLKWLFPETGDFVGVVANFKSHGLLKWFKKGWRAHSDFPLLVATLPELQLIRLSDHSCYWNAGYPALLFTDTSFLRTPHYHETTDTVDTLDYESMARVADGLEAVVRAGK